MPIIPIAQKGCRDVGYFGCIEGLSRRRDFVFNAADKDFTDGANTFTLWSKLRWVAGSNELTLLLKQVT